MTYILELIAFFYTCITVVYIYIYIWLLVTHRSHWIQWNHIVLWCNIPLVAKMKTVMIYSPSNCLKPVWVSLFCPAQNNVSWRMLVTKYLKVAHDLHYFFYTLWKSMASVNRREKRTPVWNNLTDTIFIFGWTVPLTGIWIIGNNVHVNIVNVVWTHTASLKSLNHELTDPI